MNGNRSLLAPARLERQRQIVNAHGESLGRVEHLMIDCSSGRIAYVVASFAGFLGRAERFFAIPWMALTADRQADWFILDATQEQLRNAPAFPLEDQPGPHDPSFIRSVFDFYQVPTQHLLIQGHEPG